MKYWNKQHKLRKQWHKVSLVRDPHIPQFVPYYDGWTNWAEFNKIKRKLQHYESDGKFYMEISHKDVYFEKQSDAVWFTLTWS